MKYLLTFLLCLIAVPVFADTVKVQVVFTKASPYGDYTDALYYTPSEYASLTPAQIEVQEQERLTNFVARVAEASKAEPVELTEEDLAKQAEDIQTQIDSLTAQQEEVSVKLDEKVAIRTGGIGIKGVPVEEILK